MITRYIILLFGLLTILSCQKEEDIITPIKLPVVSTQVLMTSLSGWVTSDPGFRSILYNVKFINRANVRLIHDGIVLDETSTNLEGFYSFPQQAVPISGAYVLLEKTGFFPNARTIELDTLGITANIYNFLLLEEPYLSGKGEALTSLPAMVDIIGLFEYIDGNGYAPGRTMYVNDKDGNMVGNTVTGPDDGSFNISVPAGIELDLYLALSCTTIGPIDIGVLSEDTDLGTIKYDDAEENNTMIIEVHVEDCYGASVSRAKLYYKYDENLISRRSIPLEGSLIDLKLAECRINSPFITYLIVDNKSDLDPSNDTYKKIILPHIPGNGALLSVTVCDMDDSYYEHDLSITVDNESFMDAFTIASVFEDSRIRIKANGDHGINYVEIVSDGPVTGSQFTGSIYKRGFGVFYTSDNILFTILNETEDFIELEFEGQVDAFPQNTTSGLVGKVKAIKL